MKRFFVAMIGGTILLFGLALLVLPGPGLPIIAAGLAILATEFLWARRAWRNAKIAVAKARHKTGLADWWRRRCGTKKARANSGMHRAWDRESLFENPQQLKSKLTKAAD